MKLTHHITTLRGVRCVKFKATIGKSKKLNIPKRHQKTWSFETCAPEFTSDQMQKTVEAQALRWEAKILERYKEKEEVVKAATDLAEPELFTPQTHPAEVRL